MRYEKAVRGRKVRIRTAFGPLIAMFLLTFLLEQPLLVPAGVVAIAFLIRFDPDYCMLDGTALWLGME